MTERRSHVLATSITHNDVVAIELDGPRYRVVGRIEHTTRSVGLNLYPLAVEPGRTIAALYWWPKHDRIYRYRTV